MKRKEKLLGLFMVLFTMISVNAWAGHDTHYGKVTVTSNAGGTVYIGTSNTATKGNTEEEWNCNGSSRNDSKTYYLFAKPNNGYVFAGWTGSGSSNDTPYQISVTAEKTDNNNPTTFSYTAKFIGYSNASSENPVDFTDLIVNPSFETGDMTGWTAGAKGDTGVKPNSNGTYAINNVNGNYLFNTWDGDAGNFSLTHNEVSGLANGYYRLSAIVGSNADNSIVLTANGTESTITTQTDNSANKNAAAEDIEVIFNVTNGKLNFSMTSNTWFKCDNFKLYYLGDTEVPLSVNTMGSFVAPFDVTLPSGVTAWITTDNKVSDGYLTITQTATDGKLPANTPVILRGTGRETYYGNATGEGEHNAKGNGFLVGVYEEETVPQGNYVLQKQTDEIMLYKVNSNDVKLKAYHAYLDGSKAKDAKLRLIFSDETTGISSIGEESSISAIYSASGVKFDTMQKGLNIIKMSDGSVKKVMVK